MPGWLVLLGWLAILAAGGWWRGAFTTWSGLLMRLAIAVAAVVAAGIVLGVAFVLDGGLCFDYWADCEGPSGTAAALASVLGYVGAALLLLGPVVSLLVRPRRRANG